VLAIFVTSFFFCKTGDFLLRVAEARFTGFRNE